MALVAQKFTVTDNTSEAAAAAAHLTASGNTDLDFRSAAGARTSTAPVDTDFSGGNDATIVFKVDGGSPQTVVLNTNLTNVAGVVAALQAGTTGAAWSGSSTITLTSATVGPTSSIQVVSETDLGAKSLNMAVGTTAGNNTNNYTATVVVDTNSPTTYTFTLTALYANTAALVTALNALTPLALWTRSTNVLTVSSRITGSTSFVSIAPTITGSDLKVAAGSNFGTDAVYKSTLLWTATGGSATNPQQVFISNNGVAGTDHPVAIGPISVEYASAPHILAGGNLTIPLLANESIYAIANTSDSIDVRILVTEA